LNSLRRSQNTHQKTQTIYSGFAPKPWPHVLVVEEASEGVERDIKETLEQIVLELVKAAIKRDLLTPRK